MPNTIILKGRPERREAEAAGAITPGHLINYNSDGEFIVHGTAAGNASPIFAGENELFGGDINDAYAAGDRVLGWVCNAGDEVYALVAASAAAIVAGNFLESAGNGTLRVQTAAAATTQAQRESVVAQAKESVDNSAGGTPARIRVQII